MPSSMGCCSGPVSPIHGSLGELFCSSSALAVHCPPSQRHEPLPQICSPLHMAAGSSLPDDTPQDVHLLRISGLQVTRCAMSSLHLCRY